MICRALPIALLFLAGDALGATVAGNALDIAIGETSGASVVRCPFTFQQEMPPGVFCVYDGLALGTDGRPCRERLVAIWARMTPELDTGGDLGEDVFHASDVLFGFVAFPELVIAASPDEGAAHRATIIDYTIGDDQLSVDLGGTLETRLVRAAGGGSIEVLALRVDRPVLASETCAFTSYDGIFVGMMTVPPEEPR